MRHAPQACDDAPAAQAATRLVLHERADGRADVARPHHAPLTVIAMSRLPFAARRDSLHL
eukprot:3907481-Lingulodinium_polyedra.AAC.1